MNETRVQGSPGEAKTAPVRWSPRRVGGISGLLLVLTILVNGPLSELVGRQPAYYEADALDQVRDALTDPRRLQLALLFFVLSNFIFVFGIPFFAALRLLTGEADRSGLVGGIVGIGAAFFLGGGLLSEVFSTGPALVVLAAPAYQLDVNQALFVQALWGVALSQAQVGLGIVLITVSLASLLSRPLLPAWLAAVGVAVGLIDLGRPAVVTHVPALVASFIPTFLWIAALSVVLLVWTPPRV